MKNQTRVLLLFVAVFAVMLVTLPMLQAATSPVGVNLKGADGGRQRGNVGVHNVPTKTIDAGVTDIDINIKIRDKKFGAMNQPGTTTGGGEENVTTGTVGSGAHGR